jgi:uncharacterized protein YjbI with pentapeptide repeats
MNPAVVAAIIAAGVSLLTLIGTLAAQRSSRRATSSGLDRTIAEQREQLDRTFAEQREQLDRTLAEQREQLDRTLAEQRTQTLNERFATAADELGSDKPAIRLAGVYAMAGLADDWEENRQTCVDVLCAYLRMPYEPEPGQDAPEPVRLAFRASREVRHTVIRVIAAHLQNDAAISWQGLRFDFTGVVFDGGTFYNAQFSGSQVSFRDAVFSSGQLNFNGAVFSGAYVSFGGAVFSGSQIHFGAVFSRGEVYFGGAVFSGGQVYFFGAVFSGANVNFYRAEFSGGTVSFQRAKFSDRVFFGGAVFSGGQVDFRDAVFSRGQVDFRDAVFSRGQVDFRDAVFSGGQVDFSQALDWSHPPLFTWDGTPPSGVRLPAQPSASPPDSTSGGADSPPPPGS